MHLPPLIRDLALILFVSGLVALLFRKLKQPTTLGYLIAGILVGPRVSALPTVADSENIRVWGELGVIFLLFHLGLEFSFKKLLRVGRAAIITAIVEVFGMLVLGYATGRFLGWSSLDALFLGAILSISSTAIIVKTFEDMQIKTQLFVDRVYGILILEDLIAVLMLAMLGTIAVTQSFEGAALLRNLGQLSLFLILTIPLGLFLVPRMLRWFRPYMNDEIRVVFSLGLCLALVVLSSSVGLSPALGAFLMGAFFAETAEGERIERFLIPIKDWFAAIFFTSVGMLVNPQLLISHWGLILSVVALTVVGKFLWATLGMFLARENPRLAIQTGLSLAQIGEFSFVIATLGMELGVIRPDLYPLAVAVSVATTFITPYLIRFASSARFSAQGAASPRAIGHKLWDGHLVELDIHPHFLGAGKRLEDLGLKARFGISVVMIARGDRKIFAPDGNATLMPFDRLVALGTDEQLLDLAQFFRTARYELRAEDDAHYELRKVLVREPSNLLGQSLRESGIRESNRGLVLGIERGGERLLNPDSEEILRQGDILWLYGRTAE